MAQGKSYVLQDRKGVWRVGQLGVSLDSVVIAFQQGHTAESIQQQYPALSLEEVYGAIAFYLGNRQVIHEYLECQDQVWRAWRERVEQIPNPVLERLRAARRADVQERQ